MNKLNWPIFLLALLPCITPALATPSQSEVFKSIQDSVSHSDASGPANPIPWICAGAGVILILAIFSKRQTRQSIPKTVNNVNRLLKEIMRTVPLKPRELKQLKTVAEEIRLGNDETPVNPLVLVLCPSIVVKSLNDRTTRADRRTLIGVMKKLGIR